MSSSDPDSKIDLLDDERTVKNKVKKGSPLSAGPGLGRS